MPHPFILSVETDEGTYFAREHLGTIESVARKCAEEYLAKRIPRQGTFIKTVALLTEGGKVLFDVYDGKVWLSAKGFDGLDVSKVVWG